MDLVSIDFSDFSITVLFIQKCAMSLILVGTIVGKNGQFASSTKLSAHKQSFP